MMPNKFKTLLVVSFASFAMLLSGCDDIEANLTDSEGNTPVLFDKDNGSLDATVKNNILSQIYDAVKADSNSSKYILESILFDVSESLYGEYATLATLVTKDYNSQAVVDFIKAHEVYQQVDTTKIVATGTGEDVVYTVVNLTADEILHAEFDRLTLIYDTITKRIAEKYYTEISGGTYSERNLFDEESYAVALRAKLYDIGTPSDANLDGKPDWHKDVLFTPDLEKEDVGTYGVHLDLYKDYTDRSVIPNIYRYLLVQNYLGEEYYSTLGRSYARKVNYVKIAVNSNDQSAAKKLINRFVDKYILTDSATNTGEVNFELLSTAWKGVDIYESDGITLNDSGKLLSEAGLDTYTSTNTGKVTYTATKFGQLLKEYDKITGNRFSTDEDAESTFTNSGAYTKETGLEIQTNTIKISDFTTDGWYIKNGGLTDLPDAIRTRLFNIKVASNVDDVKEEVIDAQGNTSGYTSTDYVRHINGHYYLTPEYSESTDKNNFVMYDANSSAYYIVMVDEAISTSKMSTSDANLKSYAHIHTDDVLFTEKVALEIENLLSVNSTYSNAAYIYHLQVAGILYHDQVTYDYFKTTYPDMFTE